MPVMSLWFRQAGYKKTFQVNYTQSNVMTEGFTDF